MPKHSCLRPAHLNRVATIGAITLLGLMFAGCEDSSRVEGVAWNNAGNPAPATETEAPAPDGTTPAASGDSVAFGALNWTYGGFDGGGAAHSGVTLSGLSMNADFLSFKYNTDLSAWGVSNTDHTQAIACLFVKNRAGQWVGGKIDWISSSRTSRDFHNVYGGYAGWTLGDVPNPCEAAFVIVHVGGKRRSNVITASWRR